MSVLFRNISDGLRIPLLESYETPLSAANPRAFAIASAMLTEPELTGLMELRSTLPELMG